MHSCMRIFLFSIFFLLYSSVFSQDFIYLNNGSKFEANVKELTSTEIKYKNINNPDGPTYVLSKSDVLFVEFKNGTIEVINKNPASVSPKSSTPSAGDSKPVKKSSPIDLYYMNKNSILINGLALTNADITLLYEHDFLNSHLGLTVLGAYNFNKVATWPNNYLQELSNPKKNYDLGLGVNFFPSNRRKSQYFVGLLVKYMNYSFDREVNTEEVINGISYLKIVTEKAQGYQLATMIVNGFQVRITPTVTYKAFIGLGPFNADNDLKKALNKKDGGTLPKAYLGICFGYRF